MENKIEINRLKNKIKNIRIDHSNYVLLSNWKINNLEFITKVLEDEISSKNKYIKDNNVHRLLKFRKPLKRNLLNFN